MIDDFPWGIEHVDVEESNQVLWWNHQPC